MTEAEALAALKEVCREFIASEGENDALFKLSEALDRYWVAGSSLIEPVDLDEATRRAVNEAVDWDRAFNRDPA